MTKVLITDDQENIRSVIKACLEDSTASEVIEAEDGLAAIEQMTKHKIDLVITDLNMPVMNGFELVGYIRKHQELRNIPVIMLTSMGGEANRKQAFAIGVNQFLVKPFSPDDLTPIVNKFLE